MLTPLVLLRSQFWISLVGLGSGILRGLEVRILSLAIAMELRYDVEY